MIVKTNSIHGVKKRAADILLVFEESDKET